MSELFQDLLESINKFIEYEKQENIDAYSRMLSALNEGISLQKSNISYLRGLSASCKKLYVDFKSLYEKDLYHSIAAQFMNCLERAILFYL